MNKLIILSVLSVFFLTACSQQFIKHKEAATTSASEPEEASVNPINSIPPMRCKDNEDSCFVSVSCEEYPDAEVCYSAPSHREGPSGEPWVE